MPGLDQEHLARFALDDFGTSAPTRRAALFSTAKPSEPRKIVGRALLREGRIGVLEIV